MSAGSSTAGGGAAAGSGGMGNADPESHYGHDGVSQLWVGRGKSGVLLPRLLTRGRLSWGAGLWPVAVALSALLLGVVGLLTPFESHSLHTLDGFDSSAMNGCPTTVGGGGSRALLQQLEP